MAEVLIVGASGGIGLQCTRQALDNGHSVRAFARSADGIKIHHANLTKINGDATNSTDVAAAVDGTDAVVVALGVKLGTAMLFGPVTLFSKATKILLPTMQSAGVNRLIAVTGFGAGASKQAISCFQRVPFQMVFGRAYSDKSVQEQMIKKSGLDWVIVRPGVLTNGKLTNDYQILIDPSRWRNGVISRADVAQFIVQQIEDDEYVRKAPVLIQSELPLP